MHDVVYVVTGKLVVNQKISEILYVGTDAKKAFEHLDWRKEADIIVQLWQDGVFIRKFTKE